MAIRTRCMLPKSAFFILTLVVLATSAMAQQTAYTALRVMGNNSKSAYLNQVVEVIGAQGGTQPVVWKISISDSTARGGIREFEIANGSIISERTPVGTSGGLASLAPMVMAKLNLDSDGAFTVANKIAIERRISFDSVNYALRASGSSSQPQWIVDLIGVDGGVRSQVVIAADTGNVVPTGGFDSTAIATDGWTEPMPTETTTSNASNSGGAIGSVGRGLKTAGTATKNTTLRSMGWMQEFLTGNRTIDKNVPRDED